MKKYNRKKDDLEVTIVCAYCYGEVNKEDHFCKHCGREFKIEDPVQSIKDNVDLYKKGYKNGYNDAKKDIIRLLDKEV